jgi:hypothetical protein
VLALAAFHEPALQWQEPGLPPSSGTPWETFGSRWQGYFIAWLGAVAPRTPVATPGLEALLDDFVSRSGEVSGRAPVRMRQGKLVRKRRTNLSIYWQWGVYTYGPQLLATLGTFRFLITELVPLQLIVQNRIDASSLSADGPG